MTCAPAAAPVRVLHRALSFGADCARVRWEILHCEKEHKQVIVIYESLPLSGVLVTCLSPNELA